MTTINQGNGNQTKKNFPASFETVQKNNIKQVNNPSLLEQCLPATKKQYAGTYQKIINSKEKVSSFGT